MRHGTLSNDTPAPEFIHEWRQEFFDAGSDDDTIFDLSSHKFENKSLIGLFRIDSAENILKALRNSTVNPIESSAWGNPQRVELQKIQKTLYNLLIERSGTTSHWQDIYNTIAVVFPAATTIQYIPTSKDPHIKGFLEKNNILISNIIFAATTLLSRIFVNKAQYINANIMRAKVNYKDFDHYLRTLSSLGMHKVGDSENDKLGVELKEINKIVINAWYKVLAKSGSVDLGRVSPHRVASISINMLKALSSFYISAKNINLKKALKAKLNSIGKLSNPEIYLNNSDLTALVRENLSREDLVRIVNEIPMVTLPKHFINNITHHFANIIETNSHSLNIFVSCLKHLRTNHIAFPDTTLFKDFLSRISRVARMEFNNQNSLSSRPQLDPRESELQRDINNCLSQNFSAIWQLQNKFPTFKAFSDVQAPKYQIGNEENQQQKILLASIGQKIGNRVGMQSSNYWIEGIRFVSALLCGLPLFNYIYERNDIFGFAYCYVAPIALLGVLACETLITRTKARAEQLKYEYKEFNQRIIRLVDADIINITSLADEQILDDNCYGNSNFKTTMFLIAKTLETIEKMSVRNIAFNKFSKNEQSYIAMTLFNAFSDFLLNNDASINLSELPENEVNSICHNLASFIVHNTSRNLLKSIAKLSPAWCHLSHELPNDQMLDKISFSLSMFDMRNKKLSHADSEEIKSARAKKSASASIY